MKEGHDVCEHQSNVCEIQIGGVARGRRGEGCGQPAQFRKARGVSAVRFLKKLEK